MQTNLHCKQPLHMQTKDRFILQTITTYANKRQIYITNNHNICKQKTVQPETSISIFCRAAIVCIQSSVACTAWSEQSPNSSSAAVFLKVYMNKS